MRQSCLVDLLDRGTIHDWGEEKGIFHKSVAKRTSELLMKATAEHHRWLALLVYALADKKTSRGKHLRVRGTSREHVQGVGLELAGSDR